MHDTKALRIRTVLRIQIWGLALRKPMSDSLIQGVTCLRLAVGVGQDESMALANARAGKCLIPFTSRSKTVLFRVFYQPGQR